MQTEKIKFIVVLGALALSWALMLWMQWKVVDAQFTVGLLAVPSAMVLLGLLAGVALHSDES